MIPSQPLRLRTLLLLSVVSAVLASAAFAPLDLAPLAWIAWAPWLFALATAPRARDAALSGAVHAIVLHAVQSFWMVLLMVKFTDLRWIVSLAMYAFGLATTTPYGIAVALATAAVARRRGSVALLAAPLVSALVDVLRSHMTFGYPWLIPGMTQTMHPIAMGAADLVGVHGLGVVVLLANAGVAAVALRGLRGDRSTRTLVVGAVAVTVVTAATIHGTLAQRRHAAPKAWAQLVPMTGRADAREPMATPDWSDLDSRVAILQGAQPQEVKIDASPEEELELGRVQLDLEEQALGLGANVIAWAESAHPGTTLSVPWMIPAIEQQLRVASRRVVHPEAIVGVVVRDRLPDKPPREWPVTNSALLVQPGGRAGRYDKARLVPFGEYLPWGPVFRWFPQIVDVAGSFTAGTSDEPLAGMHGRYGTIVCYEVVLPQRVRAVVAHGASVVVNITNDGWYSGTWMPEQHLRFAAMRAVETRRFVVRAANSGISAIVAPDGRIVGRMDEGRRGLLLGQVEPRTVVTPYVRWGDVPIAVLGALASAWAILEAATTLRERRARRREPAPTEAAT